MKIKTGIEITENLFGRIEGKSFNPNKAKERWISQSDLDKWLAQQPIEIMSSFAKELKQDGTI